MVEKFKEEILQKYSGCLSSETKQEAVHLTMAHPLVRKKRQQTNRLNLSF